MNTTIKRYNARKFTVNWSIRLLLLTYTAIIMYPIFWNIMSSFRTNHEILMNATALPTHFAWDNYVRAFTAANMGSFLLNTLLVIAVSIVIHLILVVPCASALARFKFPGSRLIEILFVGCFFISSAYIMIPLFALLFNMGMLDNLWALSLVYAAGGVPFSTFLLTGYMRTISPSYVEAARMDGCGNWRILRSITIPLAKPGIITISMLAVMGYWSEYVLAMVLLRSPANHTLMLGVARLFEVQQRATDFGALYAALIIVFVPTVLLYLVGQKYLIGSLNVGGVKE